MAKSEQFKFRRTDQIGALDAQQDGIFLPHCFVDIGDLNVLRDCQDPRRVIVGRTGSGKTALVRQIVDTAQRVSVLQPEQLALNYISNSTILRFVHTLGVKLDPFFRLLWRHVLIVEIIRAHSSIVSQDSKRNFVERFFERFSAKPLQATKYERAIQYLEKYGGEFWQDTEHRIKEVTSTVEKDIKAAVTIPSGALLSMEAEAGRHLSTEERQEVITRAQNVVNRIQVRELTEMLEVLDAILDDPQQRYYVVVDRLDEDWVDDRFRYGLIRALIETVREFHKVRYAKVIITLRLDLLDRVFNATRDPGFQQEKYESELLRVKWTRESLTKVLDLRINHLVKRSYTTKPLSHRDVLPARIGKQATIDYLLDRTLMRPRDLIHFFNECIQQADDKPVITERALRVAEGEYSRGRLKSLADEWFAEFPNLLVLIDLFKNRPLIFELRSISDTAIEDFCLQSLAQGRFKADDQVSAAASDVIDRRISAQEFLLNAVELLYRIGLLGLKLDALQPIMWSIDGRRSISTAEISSSTKIQIHRCFWRVLGVSDRAVDENDEPL